MSKSKKGNQRNDGQKKKMTVNTLGIDTENPVEADEFGTEPPLSLAEKIINYATLALTVLLLGGSLVFWWIVTKHLILNPSNLVDSKEMLAELVCCAVVPLLITVIQAIFRKPVSIESWLVCMCVSGVASAVFVLLYQVWIRSVLFPFSDFPTLLCCTVSGSALPAMIYLGLRSLIKKIAPVFARKEPFNFRTWEAVKRDVLALTDFVKAEKD